MVHSRRQEANRLPMILSLRGTVKVSERPGVEQRSGSRGGVTPPLPLRLAEARPSRTSEHENGAPPWANLHYPQPLSRIEWHFATVMRSTALEANNLSPTAKEQN